MRVMKTLDEFLKADCNIYRDSPHGWLQWKGTDACMDVHCICGELSHIDGDFLYAVRCPACKRCYAIDGHVEFVLLEESPDEINEASL